MAKHECGECIFCTSKCPECDSTSINVKFNIECQYHNHSEDRISISQEVAISYFECMNCGFSFDVEFGEEVGGLQPLELSLNKYYADVVRIKHSDDGKITNEEFNITSSVIKNARGQS